MLLRIGGHDDAEQLRRIGEKYRHQDDKCSTEEGVRAGIDLIITYDIKGLSGAEFAAIRRALMGKGFNKEIALELISKLERLRKAAAESIAGSMGGAT